MRKNKEEEFVEQLEIQIKEADIQFQITGDTTYLEAFDRLKEKRINYFLRYGF